MASGHDLEMCEKPFMIIIDTTKAIFVTRIKDDFFLVWPTKGRFLCLILNLLENEKVFYI